MDSVFGLFRFGGITGGALLNVVLLFMLVAILIHSKFKPIKEAKYWLPLVVMLAVSVAYSPYLASAIRSLLVVITYFAMFLIPFHFIKSEQHFIECIRVLVYSSLLPLVAVIYELIFPAGSTNVNGFRLYSTFGHPNVFAFYLVTIVSVCFYVIKSNVFINDAKFRKLCFYVMFFGLLCILGTKTRSAWAVIAFLILIYGLFRERQYLIYLGVAAVIALMIPSIQDRIFDLFQGNDTDAFLNDYETLNSYAWRKIIWASALEKFWERPFFGFGYESFTYYSGDFFIIENEKGAGAHNTYVQFLFEIGVIGFTAFIWLLLPLLSKLWDLRNKASENIIVFALFGCYCLIHYSDNVFDYLTFNWYFWFFIGAFLAFSKIESTEGQKIEN